MQLVGLSPRLALLVVVLSDGAVEKRTVDLAVDAADDVLADAAAHLTASRAGRHPGARRCRCPSRATRRAQRRGALRPSTRWASSAPADEPDHVFVGGSSRMASAFDAVETVRSVLSILEQQLVVVELIEDILDRGLSVAIGAEHGFEPLASCALVVAPVAIDGEVAGTIGVVGPTRMHYPRALAAVELVGEQLGEHLGAATSTASGPTGRRSRRRPSARATRRRQRWRLTTTRCSGWPRDASDDEIKRAYRRMARELHPDSTGGDAAAEARFKEVTRAYEVLRDPERRARYDRFGPDGVDAAGPARATSSAAGSATCSTPSSAGRRAGSAGAGAARCGVTTPRSSLELEFREAVFGRRARAHRRTRLVACATCEGTGARAGHHRRCAVPSARVRASCTGCASRSWARWSRRCPADAVAARAR